MTNVDAAFSDIPAEFTVSLYSPKQGFTASCMLVRKGLAWHRPSRTLDEATAKELAHAQALAKKEKLGIWGLKDKPTPPWEFRAKKKASKKEKVK